MASYYDLSTYDAEDGSELDRQALPMINLCAAAAYVGSLLQISGLQYGVMGGFAMVCRGSSRTTADVDIATNASMKELWNLIEPAPGKVLPRLMIPNTKLLDKVIRLFVRTGPSHGDDFCTEDCMIEVDINVFGGRSGPSDLGEHLEIVEVDFGGQSFYINVLDVYYMMRTKLRTLTARAAARDFDDIDFLLLHYGAQVVAISDKLSLEDRAHFIDTDLVQSRGPIAITQYQKLLRL